MTRKAGNDYHVWLESAAPGTYNRIKGQGNCSVTRNGQTIDASAKEDFPVGIQLPGMRQQSISLELMVDLPDANGYSRLETLYNASSPTSFNVQIRKGGIAGTGSDVVYQGLVYCTDLNTDFAQNGAAKVNTTFVAAAVPAVDTLA